MCGRYVITLPPEAMARLFKVQGRIPNFGPTYNASPGQHLPILRLSADGRTREIVLARWGLVPAWSRGPDARFSMINARVETVADKPAFRAPFRRQRCVVPADGFYEWKPEKGGKRPYYISATNGEPLAFAGLWDRWSAPDGTAIESYTIIVTDANASIRPIHERMPVILSPESHESWLGETPSSLNDIERCLRPSGDDALQAWPVSRDVNRPSNDYPQLVEAVSPAEGGKSEDLFQRPY